MIEFDGKQHFEPNDFFGGQKQFEKQQHHDKIKTEYCRTNKIPLLRISYKEIKEIPNIIDEYMKKLKKNKSLIHFSDKQLYKHLA